MSLRALTHSAAFDALRNRHYRYILFASIISSAVFQMGMVAQGWLVYELTGSALALAWVGSGWSISTLLVSLWAGVIADRIDKRTLLLAARGVTLLNSLTIAVLISLGAIRVWHLLVSSMLTGVAFSFLMPAQQAWIAELLERRTLLNAAALGAVGMGLTGILAAGVAGVLIEAIGTAGVYFVMAGMYVIAIWSINRLPSSEQRASESRSVWADLREGVAYMLRDPVMMGIMVLGFGRVLFAMPFRTFMPKYTTEVLGMEAAGLGLLLSAPAAGALLSSLGVAGLGDFQRKGWLLLISGVGVGVALVLFALLPYLPLAMLFAALVGVGDNNCMVVTNALVQTQAQARFRGRAMGMVMLIWGFSPLGTIPSGAIADITGVPPVLVVQGLLLAGVYAAVWLTRPELRRLA